MASRDVAEFKARQKERLALLDSFPGSSLIPDCRPLPVQGGYSGASVYFLQYQPVNREEQNEAPPGVSLDGWYFVKVGDQRWADREERIYRDIAEKEFEEIAARYVARTQPQRESDRVAIAYEPTFGTVLGTSSLNQLLNDPSQEGERECVRNIERLINRLILWNKPAWEPDHIDQAGGRKPLDVIKSMFTQERLQKVLPRLAADLPDWDWDLDTPNIWLPEVRTKNMLLPNPLAYLRETTWQNLAQRDVYLGSYTLPYPKGRSHGDLHTRNVICLPKTEECPQLIDFADFMRERCLFFDLAYLEYDLLRSCFSSFSNSQERNKWLGFLDWVMAREIVPTDTPATSYQRPYYHISPIRKAVSERVAALNHEPRSVRQGFEVAWWAATVAVGLNYASKKNIAQHERKGALLYAAFGLNRLLSVYDLRSANHDAAPVLWIGEDFPMPTSRTGRQAVNGYRKHSKNRGDPQLRKGKYDPPIFIHLQQPNQAQRRMILTWEQLKMKLAEQGFICTFCNKSATTACCTCQDVANAHALLLFPRLHKNTQKFATYFEQEIRQIKSSIGSRGIHVLSISPQRAERYREIIERVMWESIGAKPHHITFSADELFDEGDEMGDEMVSGASAVQVALSNNYVVAKVIQWAKNTPFRVSR